MSPDVAPSLPELLKRIEGRDFLYRNHGLGYVRLPLAMAAIGSRFEVVGFDIDTRRVALLNRGESGIAHLSGNLFKSAVESERALGTNVVKA